MSKKKSFVGGYIDAALKEKLIKISAEEGRSLTKQLVCIVKEWLEKNKKGG